MISRYAYSLSVLALLVGTSCTAELEEKLATTEQTLATSEQELASTRADVEKKTGELAALQQRVTTLETENKTLKQTAKFFFNTGMDAFKAKDWSTASESFTAVVERFPANPLASEAKRKLSEVSNEKLGDYLTKIDASLSLSDKATYTAAAEKLTEAIEGCPGCSNGRAAQSKLTMLRGTLEKWPEEMASIKMMKLQYSDLRGKPLRLSRATAAGDTYYNCSYKSDTTWRAFKVADGDYRADRVHAYCRKGRDFCETLFKKVVGNPAIIRDIQLKYPYSNNCAEGQIELLGWSE